MATFTEYVQYFENIAKNHKSIRHSQGNKHFFKIELEELMTGLRSSINYPALVIEGYDFRYQDAASDNVLKTRHCAFDILLKPKNTGDFEEIYSLYAEAEAIADDIVNLMSFHKRWRTHSIVAEIDLNSIEALPINGFVENAVGYRVSFEMQSGHNTDVELTKWININF